MADTKISALTAYSTVSTSDLLVVVDVDDTTMASSGTDKKMALSMLTSWIDAVVGSTRGSIAYRGASAWTALSPGTNGQVLTSQGAGADPTWGSSGGAGTVTSVSMTVPSWLTVTGSPVTTSGTLAVAADATQTANYVLATPNGSTGALTVRALVAADIPSTGLAIKTHYSTYSTASDGATVTFDLSVSNFWQVTLGGNRTLALSNATTGQPFTIKIIQDATGSRTVTWFSGISWYPNGTVPTLTTTASKKDIFTFKCTGTNTYDGFVAGLNGS